MMNNFDLEALELLDLDVEFVDGEFDAVGCIATTSSVSSASSASSCAGTAGSIGTASSFSG